MGEVRKMGAEGRAEEDGGYWEWDSRRFSSIFISLFTQQSTLWLKFDGLLLLRLIFSLDLAYILNYLAHQRSSILSSTLPLLNNRNIIDSLPSMGLQSSRQSQSLQVSLSHPSLSNPCLLSLSGKLYLKVNCTAEEVEYQRWKAALSRFRTADPLPRRLLLPVQSSFSQNGICSSAGTAEIVYEKYCRLLSELLYHRTARKIHFSEPEIWEVLLSIVQAEREAQTFGEVVGDVGPGNVFLNEAGGMLVGGRVSWPAGRTAFEKGVERAPAFVSPEDMGALSSGAMKPCDPITSDIFALGLTLLSLANLADYSSLYRMGQRKMDLEGLQAGLVDLRRRAGYSQILRCIILNLCSCLPERRMTLEELCGLLAGNQAKIEEKQQFVIGNAPGKLHREVEELRAFVVDNPMLFASTQLLSEAGGSGLAFPEHLDVHRVTPEYVFEETRTIINQLQ